MFDVHGVFVGRLKLLAVLALASLSACTTMSNVPAATGLRDGTTISAPLGWVDFCKRNPGDPGCAARPLDKQSWNDLQDAQFRMRAIRYVPDSSNYGQAEHWQVAVKSGDCEDLSLAARKRLLDLGWPPSVLRLATVFTETREVHSVLTIEVSEGGRRETLVIDSRQSDVTSWNKLADMGYWFVSRQAANGTDWVKVNDGQGRGWKRT